ncbi:hypothetical protein ACHAXA_000914 [Cyclostephanos tholiformis]|uniref:Uncharacterized protein n=1 Tax=Cyclostephanos tholiformis TaxID=382380 RepID=A0ABD3RFY0_9STRA
MSTSSYMMMMHSSSIAIQRMTTKIRSTSGRGDSIDIRRNAKSTSTNRVLHRPMSSFASLPVVIVLLPLLPLLLGGYDARVVAALLGGGPRVSSGGTHGRRPQLSITIRDGNFTDIDGLDPTITWQNSALLSNDYGIDLSARTTNLASLPRRVWGRASRVFLDRYALSTRLELDFECPDRLDFEIDGEDADNDLRMRIVGYASNPASSSTSSWSSSSSSSTPRGGDDGRWGGGRTSSRNYHDHRTPRISYAEFTKGYDNAGNRVTVNPRYDFDRNRGDVVVTYDADDTLIRVTASRHDQIVTISQKLNDDNVISPTIGRDGSLSLAWDRKIGDDMSVRTTLNPNRSVDVEWRDAAWTANVNFPMDDNDLRGATVHIKRDIKF